MFGSHVTLECGDVLSIVHPVSDAEITVVIADLASVDVTEGVPSIGYGTVYERVVTIVGPEGATTMTFDEFESVIAPSAVVLLYAGEGPEYLSDESDAFSAAAVAYERFGVPPCQHCGRPGGH